MSPELAPYAIVAWLLAMVALFPSLPPHRAMLLIVLSGSLFLPEAVRGVVELGPIKLGKFQAIGYAGLLAALLYDSARLFAFVPRRIDWPMIAWCAWPLPSVLLNDPPPDGSPALRDAAAQTLSAITGWGIPYFLGRVYFADRAALRDLAVSTVAAAAVYAPLCLWESRMSPQLHGIVYGYAQHDFLQTIRFGGYRPMVFMQHGLAVGMFVASGALLAVWLRRPLALPGYLLLLVPVVVLVKSTGAIALALAGGAVLWLSPTTGSRWWLLLLLALPVAYCSARASGLWSGAEMVEWTAANIEQDRAGSLEFRLNNENILIAKALQRPLAGWGGWGRGRVYNEAGEDVSVTDGLWVIVLGDRGVVGLVLLGAAMLLPVGRFAVGTPPERWHAPEVAPATGCAVVVTLWVLDSLFNAMPNPLYVVMAGALAGWEPALVEQPPGGRLDVPGQHPGQK